jgi:hypothetical protein
MADSDRILFAASSADYGVLSDGSPDLSAVFEVYDALSGGSHITDLRSGSDVTVVKTHVEVDATDGTFRFYGPEFYKGSLWIVGAGGKRFEAKPTGLAERAVALETAQATLSSTVATAVSDLSALTGTVDAISLPAFVAIAVGSADPSPLPADGTLLVYYNPS